MIRPRAEVHSAELTSGCVLADNMISAARASAQGASTTGVVTYSRGANFAGGQRVEYSAKTITFPFSAAVQFAADTAHEGVLLGNANVLDGQLQAGFCVWVDVDGVRATVCDGVNLETALELDLDYADGELRTVTYVVEAGLHTLYVGDQSISAAITITGPLSSSAPVCAGGLLT